MKKIHLKLPLKSIKDGLLNGADRTPHISQAQSVNIFVPADIHKKALHDIHFKHGKKVEEAFITVDPNQSRELKM